MDEQAPKLPELPAIPPGKSLPYSQIRYVDGYPNLYLYEYARAYALQAVKEDRERMAAMAEEWAKVNGADAGRNSLRNFAENVLRNAPLPKE